MSKRAADCLLATEMFVAVFRLNKQTSAHLSNEFYFELCWSEHFSASRAIDKEKTLLDPDDHQKTQIDYWFLFKKAVHYEDC